MLVYTYLLIYETMYMTQGRCMLYMFHPYPGGQAVPFQRRHPLSCWFSSMLMCFSGSIICNMILGEPIITPFKDHRALITASIIWSVVVMYQNKHRYYHHEHCLYNQHHYYHHQHHYYQYQYYTIIIIIFTTSIIIMIYCWLMFRICLCDTI